MTYLAFLFLSLSTVGTAEARPNGPAAHAPRVETSARPSPAATSRSATSRSATSRPATSRPVATPRRGSVYVRPATRATVAPRATPARVRVTRVRRGGQWVHTAPRRFSVGNLLWIGDRGASVVRIHGGRALVEYTNGVRSWIRIG